MSRRNACTLISTIALGACMGIVADAINRGHGCFIVAPVYGARSHQRDSPRRQPVE